MVLCYLEGLTHEEAAIRLRWPVGTVRSRALFRSVPRIQADLAESARIDAELQKELNDLRAELESLRRPAATPAPSQLSRPASSPASAPNTGGPAGNLPIAGTPTESYMGGTMESYMGG